MEQSLLDMKKFYIDQLDADGKKVLTDFETLFINLRRKKASLPDEFFLEAKDFLITSCVAQIRSKKKALQHFASELDKDLKYGCEINSISNHQVRRDTNKDFIDTQKREGRWLPAKYCFWDRVWYLAKWLAFPVTITYYLVLTPAKIRDKIRFNREAKQAASVGTHGGTTGTIHIPAKRAAADAANVLECTRFGNVMQIRIGSSATSDVIGSSETEKKEDATENTGDAKTEAGTKADAEPAAEAQPEKPPGKTSKARQHDISADELDKIMAEVADVKK